MLLEDMPPWVRAELQQMDWRLNLSQFRSGPTDAIFFDAAHQTMWGGSSHHGEDH